MGNKCELSYECLSVLAERSCMFLYCILIVIVMYIFILCISGVPRFGGVQTPPPEIPKALQNRAKLNLIMKTVKNC